MRNPLSKTEQRAIRVAASKPGHAIGRALARLAGVKDPGIRWRFVEGPLFNNQIATLKLNGRDASLRLDKTTPPGVDVSVRRPGPCLGPTPACAPRNRG